MPGYSGGGTLRFGATYYVHGERRASLKEWIAFILLACFLLLTPFILCMTEIQYHDMLVAFREVEDR